MGLRQRKSGGNSTAFSLDLLSSAFFNPHAFASMNEISISTPYYL
nr:MAG TPA: hypothetical protein [Caudoviricetes sp.]